MNLEVFLEVVHSRPLELRHVRQSQVLPQILRRAPQLVEVFVDIDAVFAALADRSRRRIIATLAADPQDNARACGSFDIPVSKATRTHHFRVLREASLIEQRHHGNGSSVTLRRADIQAHLPGLLDILLTELRETPQ